MTQRTATPPAGPQWEYKFVNFGADGYEKKANDLGKDGWELVGGPIGETNFFFKRPKAVSPPATATYRGNLSRLAEKVAEADGTTEVIPLKRAIASQMATTLATLFAGRLVISSDAQSNALLVKGPAELVREVKGLIEKLEALPGKDESKPRTR